MCIIIHKPKGIEIPFNRLKTCYDNNKDGVGFMFATGKEVVIEKGFMSFPDFMTRINALKTEQDTKNLDMVIHFRLATHGDKGKGNCHPFPLSQHTEHLLKELATAEIGVAHNGCISGLPRDKHLSDTLLFVQNIMSGFRWKHLKRPETQALIELATNSKWAILHKCGQVLLYGGKWIKDDGCHYSNSGYLETLSWYSGTSNDWRKYYNRGYRETANDCIDGMDYTVNDRRAYAHLDYTESDIEPEPIETLCEICELETTAGRLCPSCIDWLSDYLPELLDKEEHDRQEGFDRYDWKEI